MDVEKILSQMTVREKAMLVTGKSYWATADISRLDVPSIQLCDGPNGLRKQAGSGDNLGLNHSVEATCFPTASAIVSTFNPELMEEVGTAIAEECEDEEVSVLLGPGINIKRHPACGRNFEYMSEDPLVSGKMGAAFIRGVQKENVGACVKHFAVNNQEKGRMITDSIVDERTLREIYLKGFEIAVKEAAHWAVMGSYNKVNGTYACENPWLLKKVLREEWGYRGAVITDWGAMNDQKASYENGLSLEMPGIGTDQREALAAAAENGEISEKALDSAARDVLLLIERVSREQKKNVQSLRTSEQSAQSSQTLEQSAQSSQTLEQSAQSSQTLEQNVQSLQTSEQNARLSPSPGQKAKRREKHLQTARKAASEGAVLLKNNGLLPVSKTKSIAIIGAFAKVPRYQGAGSSKINPRSLVSVCESFDQAGIPYAYAEGYQPETTEPDSKRIAEAVSAAGGKDVVLLFAGLPDSCESEGYDREHMNLPRTHNALIRAVVRANPNTAVILMCGSPVELPWADKVPAILLAYLGGCQGGPALKDILLGEVNPSGKLAETWPVRKSDVYCDPIYPECPQTVYREGIYVGYRYYDTAQKEVRFPFGHGLSYSDFCYESMTAEAVPEALVIQVCIRNTSSRDGSEIVQIYTSLPVSAVHRPAKELRAFQKIFLKAGEARTTELRIPYQELAYYSIAEKRWIVETGDYLVQAAASSRDIRLVQTVHVEGEKAPREPGEFYKTLPPQVTDITDEMFAGSYGGPLPEISAEHRPFTSNATLADVSRETLFGKLLSIAVDFIGKKTFGKDPASRKMYASLKYETPFRGLSLTGMSFPQIRGLLAMCNGRYLKGLKELWRRKG